MGPSESVDMLFICQVPFGGRQSHVANERLKRHWWELARGTEFFIVFHLNEFKIYTVT